MDRIQIKNILPNVFTDAGELSSGIWNTKTEFERGNSYLIEAGSGKGKSSFCSFLYGYRKDYQGEIFFDRKNITGIPLKAWDNIRQKELSLLFQELNLFAELTAWENVILKNNLTSYKSIQQIEEMFDRLEISDKKNQLTGKTSWGQQQRIAIIRCLCQPFDFLILDEPISHLDDKNAAIIAGLIEEEVSARGAGLIVTSIGKHLPVDYTYTFAL